MAAEEGHDLAEHPGVGLGPRDDVVLALGLDRPDLDPGLAEPRSNLRDWSMGTISSAVPWRISVGADLASAWVTGEASRQTSGIWPRGLVKRLSAIQIALGPSGGLDSSVKSVGPQQSTTQFTRLEKPFRDGSPSSRTSVVPSIATR